MKGTTAGPGDFAFYDFKPHATDMADEVLRGLSATPKMLSPKYFYDARGSALFEQITELEEYYPTRTEMGLFDQHLPEIGARLGHDVCVIEYGSGSSKKIRKVLESITPVAYVPVDISGEHLQANARRLYEDFPWIHMYPVCADMTQSFELPPPAAQHRLAGFFPGSSIGNFSKPDARQFLQHVRDTVGTDGALIIGVDRKKDPAVLEAAYNDAQGVTAQFNLNALEHINTALGTDFDTGAFEHRALYNEAKGCIQMFLESTRAQVVTLAGARIDIGAGERIHTENSYKYDPEEFLALAADAGFAQDGHWTDARDWFSLFLLRGC